MGVLRMRRRSVLRCVVVSLVLVLLALRSQPYSQSFQPEFETYSVVFLDGQQLDFKKSPPAPATFSHTPLPRLPWFREVDTERFPGPEYVNVSAQPMAWVTDKRLWLFREYSISGPGVTTIDFRWASPSGASSAAIFVITNTGPNVRDGSHLIQAFGEGGILISTESGPGWTQIFSTAEGIRFFGNKAHSGTWSFTETVNGVSATTPFFVRALDVQNFGITPSPYDPTQGPGLIKADIVGLPPSPDPAAWVPEPETTWTLTIQDPVSGGTLWTFTGTSNQIALSFDGIATPEVVAGLPSHAGSHIVVGEPIPGGVYPMRLSAVASLRRTSIAVDGTLAVGGLEVKIRLSPSITALAPSRDERLEHPLVAGEANNAIVTVRTEDCDGNPAKNLPLKLIISVPGQDALLRRGGHYHSPDRPLGRVRILETQTGPLLYQFNAQTNRVLVETTQLPRTSQDNVFTFRGTRFRTNDRGEAFVKFIASQLGGEIQIEVIPINENAEDLTLCPGTRNSVTLDVAVRGLVDLPTSVDSVLTGGTVDHPGPSDDPNYVHPVGAPNVNHYGASDVITAIDNIASDWFPRMQNEFRLNRRLRINDISLNKGGLFDINGNWRTPHSTHRLGRDVDVARDPTNSEGIPADLRLEFQRTVRDVWRILYPTSTITPIVEPHPRDNPNHFHIYF